MQSSRLQKDEFFVSFSCLEIKKKFYEYVITLGQELHFARHLPQVILSFEKQTEIKLFFTVILATPCTL
ncbi:MAG: hypothetical protein QNJ27_00710 [Simkaniaceae bacterium]|nr:hypothetical protein [Simkaniaceae bacterium]